MTILGNTDFLGLLFPESDILAENMSPSGQRVYQIGDLISLFGEQV